MEGRVPCTLPTTVESIYLQFRHVLELIATASLSVNQVANDELRKEGRKKWHAGHILDAVETVNPGYYYPQTNSIDRVRVANRPRVEHRCQALPWGVEGLSGRLPYPRKVHHSLQCKLEATTYTEPVRQAKHDPQ